MADSVSSQKEAGHAQTQANHPRSGPGTRGRTGLMGGDAAREKFMAAYERVFALWPQPNEEFDIETATATTRVHAYRPHSGGAPVLLVTGARSAIFTPKEARVFTGRREADHARRLAPSMLWQSCRGGNT